MSLIKIPTEDSFIECEDTKLFIKKDKLYVTFANGKTKLLTSD